MGFKLYFFIFFIKETQALLYFSTNWFLHLHLFVSMFIIYIYRERVPIQYKSLVFSFIWFLEFIFYILIQYWNWILFYFNLWFRHCVLLLRFTFILTTMYQTNIILLWINVSISLCSMEFFFFIKKMYNIQTKSVAVYKFWLDLDSYLNLYSYL